MARYLILLLLILLLGLLQWKLWRGEGGLGEVRRLQEAVERQEAENRRLAERNRALAEEVLDLRSGLEAIEERARSELGMIKKDETFYQVVEEEPER